MKTVILSIGSRGDVQPCVALGTGLRDAGHHVRLATHESFRSLVENRGLEFFPIAGNPKMLLEGEIGQTWLESGRNPFKFLGMLAELAQPIIDELVTDCWNACQGAEAILYSTLGVPGYHIAEKLGLPSFQVHLAPTTPTREFPSLWVPRNRNLGPILNELSGILSEQLAWQTFRPYVNEKRVKLLNLPTIPFFGAANKLMIEHSPVLYGFSRHVVPKPADWGSWIHVTGYWFLDHLSTWRPPDGLIDFLASGPAPVYIGFGSMTPRYAEELAEMSLKALKLSRQRGIILSGWAGLGSPHVSDDIYVVESIPHDWLFPQVAAVVHHGGAGTTAAGLRAGRPSVITPLFGDQPFWGRRVHALGAGPAPVRQKELTADILADLIRCAVTDESISRRAARLGELIRAEDGVGAAVKAFEQHISWPLSCSQ